MPQFLPLVVVDEEVEFDPGVEVASVAHALKTEN